MASWSGRPSCASSTAWTRATSSDLNPSVSTLLTIVKPTTTRTLNPLPFEHLEVHRFEDLIRQLSYDFKRWRRLEATGRAGADDVFDARGLKIVEDDEIPAG